MLAKNNVLLFYVLLIALISIALFLYGFFPIAHHGDAVASQLDVPGYVGDVNVKKHSLYSPMVTRLIIMVIDGLRWDFVAGPVGKDAMPMTSSLLANSSGCLLQAKLQSPTVTMPRIKAMMTGTVPNFVDIVLNFGSKPLYSDSLLLQAKKHEHVLVFYGDDTWLSLFPSVFERHDGTTSFFVTDFTEVDDNVTRHIEDELNHDDWSVMILHYLGLDHIGHIEGPFGASIKPKLQEMDEIVAQIARRVQYWNNDGTPALFVVCGDHGMKDSGGHGGSTPQETTVPFVAIGKTRCSRQENGEPIEVEQLDVATTLSAVLGLPIPSTNLGSVFLDSIYSLGDAKRLFLLYYNSRQVFDRFRKLAHRESQIEYVHRKYLNTVKLHADWLKASDNPSGMVENIVLSYNAILKEMKDALISSMVKHDFRPMVIAMLFLCQILIILFFVQNVAWTTYKKPTSQFLVRFLLCIGIYYFCGPKSMVSVHPMSILKASLFLFVIAILYINCDLCATSHLSLIEFKESKLRGAFQIGAFLHVVSLAGSSFIEEEHQTWYFFWTSTIVCLLYHCCARLLAHHREVLRKLNSTGDKWAHLPDIARWLKEDDSKVGMTLLLLTALVLLTWIAHQYEDKKYRWQTSILTAAGTVCIYLRHMANGAVLKIPFYFSSSGLYEVQTFWGITTLLVVCYGYRAISAIRRNRRRFASTALRCIINTWVMISAMLHQPYNVILLPVQIIASSTIDEALWENDLLDLGVFVHCWLGNVFYFYQGNSNSLASVDIAAGYVGLRSYVPFITGIYLVINTYSAPVLAYFLLVHQRHSHRMDVVQTSRTYIAWRLLTIIVYMIVVACQRHHLFVWSVFSPKLLYEAVHSAIMCCSVLLALIVITLQAAIIPDCASHKD